MTESEITQMLRLCIERAFGFVNNEVGEEEFEDGDMFFEDGYFYISLYDGSLCKTTYTAEDFLMIRYRCENEDVLSTPYVVIYMKNGDKLYYNDIDFSYENKFTWELCRVGHRKLEDDALINFFDFRRNAKRQKMPVEKSREVNVVEYEDAFKEQAKDLLVELQRYLASLDKRKVLVLKDGFREEYFAYLMGKLERNEGKLFLARSGEEVTGLIACMIFEGGEEREITTSCPKIGFISDLVVTEKARGKKIGTALLAAAENYFTEHNCVFTQLEVFAPNSDARRFYEDFGFRTNCFYLSKRTKY